MGCRASSVRSHGVSLPEIWRRSASTRSCSSSAVSRFLVVAGSALQLLDLFSIVPVRAVLLKQLP